MGHSVYERFRANQRESELPLSKVYAIIGLFIYHSKPLNGSKFIGAVFGKQRLKWLDRAGSKRAQNRLFSNVVKE